MFIKTIIPLKSKMEKAIPKNPVSKSDQGCKSESGSNSKKGCNFFCNKSISLKFFFSFLIAGLDQSSKWLAECFINKVVVINDYFNLVLLYNKGISFSLFASNHWYGKALIVAMTFLVVFLVLKLMYDAVLKTELYGYVFIIGGAIGNLIDRLFRKGVVDFLDFHVKGYHWPAFNVADTFIVVGALLVLISKLVLEQSIKNRSKLEKN